MEEDGIGNQNPQQTVELEKKKMVKKKKKKIYNTKKRKK